jgi:adhesin/invasin
LSNSGKATIAVKSTAVSGNIIVISSGTGTAGLQSSQVSVITRIGAASKVVISNYIPMLLADGISITTITALLTDSFGNQVTNATDLVMFNLTGAGVIEGSPVNAVNGIATVRYRASVIAQTSTITVTSEGLLSCTTTVTTLPGQASKLTVNSSRMTITADGVSITTITVQLTDSNNNIAISTEPVMFTIGGEGGTWFDDSVGARFITPDGGIATVRIKASTKSGQITVNVWTGSISTKTVTITVIPGTAGILQINSQVTSIKATGIEITTITVKITDLFNNVVTTATNNVLFNISGKGTWRDNTQNPKSEILNNGIATIAVKSGLETGQIITSATVTGLLQPTTSIIITTYQLPPGRLSLASTKPSLISDGSDTCEITGYLLDADGNRITDSSILSGRQLRFTIADTSDGELSGGDAGGTSLNQSDEVDAANMDINKRYSRIQYKSPNYDGIKTTLITATLVGIDTVTASIELKSSKVGVPVYIDLTVGAQSAGMPALVADGISSFTVIAYIKDAVGTLLDGSASTSPVTNNTVTFNVTGPCSYDVSRRVQDTVSGIATIRINSNKQSGVIRVTATSIGLISGTTELVTIPGSASKLIVERVGATMVALTADGNDTTDLTVKVLDTNDNLVTSYNQGIGVSIFGEGTWSDGTVGATFMTPAGGIATLKIKSTTRTGQIIIISTSTGLTSATTSFNTVSGAPAKLVITNKYGGTIPSLTADGNTTSDLAVKVLDSNNNVVNTDIGTQVGLVITGEGTWNDGSVSPRQVGISQGSTTISLRSTTKAGQVIINASGTDLTGDTTSFMTTPGIPAKLTLVMNKQVLTADGSDETGLTVYVKDYNDNITNEIRNTKLEIPGGSDGSGVIVTTGGITVSSITVTSINGQVSGLKVRSGTKSGTLTLKVISSGLTSVSQDITLVPDTAKKLSIKWDSLPPSYLSADGISSTTITIELQDVNGNKVTSPDYNVTLRTSEILLLRQAQDQNDSQLLNVMTTSGTAVVTLKSTIKSGTAVVIAGSYGLESGELNITVKPQPAVKINLTVDQPELIAGGQSQTIVRANIVDVNNNIITDRSDGITYKISGEGEWGESPYGTTDKVKQMVNGEASISVRSVLKTGTIQVTANTAGLLPGNKEITVIAGLPDKLLVTGYTSQLTADGVSKSTITVTAVDSNGNLISSYNGQITITALGPVQESLKVCSITGGITDFMLTSMIKTGSVLVKITSLMIGSTELMLTMVPQEAMKINMMTGKSQLVSDGQDVTTLQATLEDVNGNEVTTATNTVIFEITGAQSAGTWEDGTITPRPTVMTQGGINISLRSTTRAGTITITGRLYGTNGIELSSGTISLITVAMSDPKKVALRLKQGSLGSIPADGLSETIIECVITDIYNNPIQTVSNTVIFKVEGEGNIISGTQAVKIAYVNTENGLGQIKLRAGTKSETMLVTGESSGLESSTMTIVIMPGIPYKLVFEESAGQQYELIANGKDNMSLKAVIKDMNDNTVTTYNSVVLFTIQGQGTIDTSSSVVSVNGAAEVTVRSATEIGTAIISARTGAFSTNKSITIKSSLKNGLQLNISPKYIYSSAMSTVTVTIVDEYNNAVLEDGVEVTLTVESGEFIVLDLTEVIETSPFTVSAVQGKARVNYKGYKQGMIKITATSSGLSSVDGYINVIPSTIPVNAKISVSSVVYVPANFDLVLEVTDKYENSIQNLDTYMTLTGTNTYGEQIISTECRIVNGSGRYNVNIFDSGVYTFKLYSGNLNPGLLRMYAMINKSIETTLNTQTSLGLVKLKISSGTFNSDLILEINDKPQITTTGQKKFSPVTNKNMIELVAKDSAGNRITDSIIFNSGKYIELTIPYMDKNDDGIVDGTSIREENLRILMFETGVWKILGNQTDVIDSNQNTLLTRINKLGIYSAAGVPTDPTITNVVVYPNPFNSSTKFVFEIGADADIKVDIYTITGRLINSLTKQVAVNEIGYTELTYDGMDINNDQIANGTYIYKISTRRGNVTHTKTGKFSRIR